MQLLCSRMLVGFEIISLLPSLCTYAQDFCFILYHNPKTTRRPYKSFFFHRKNKVCMTSMPSIISLFLGPCHSHTWWISATIGTLGVPIGLTRGCNLMSGPTWTQNAGSKWQKRLAPLQSWLTHCTRLQPRVYPALQPCVWSNLGPKCGLHSLNHWSTMCETLTNRFQKWISG